MGDDSAIADEALAAEADAQNEQIASAKATVDALQEVREAQARAENEEGSGVDVKGSGLWIHTTGHKQEYVGAGEDRDVIGFVNETIVGPETRLVTGHFKETIGGGENRAVVGDCDEFISGHETRLIGGGITETVAGGGEVRIVNGGIQETINGSMVVKASGDVTLTGASSVINWEGPKKEVVAGVSNSHFFGAKIDTMVGIELKGVAAVIIELGGAIKFENIAGPTYTLSGGGIREFSADCKEVLATRKLLAGTVDVDTGTWQVKAGSASITAGSVDIDGPTVITGMTTVKESMVVDDKLGVLGNAIVHGDVTVDGNVYLG